MKRIIILLLTGFLISCGSSKVVRSANKSIKGNWILSDVNYDKTGVLDLKLFNDASYECFNTSTWQFTPNNYSGNYSIVNTTCSTGDRFFKFDIQNIEGTNNTLDVLLKPTNNKYKSETNKGFRVKVTELTTVSMQWQYTIRKDKNPLTIVMKFTKLD